VCDLVVVYVDRGISKGMTEGIKESSKMNVPVEVRSFLEGTNTSFSLRIRRKVESDPHSGQKVDYPFSCEYCNQKFSTELSYNIHKSIMHRAVPLEEEETNADEYKNTWIGPYPNLRLGVAYPSAITTREPELDRNTEYKCKWCGAVFIGLKNLRDAHEDKCPFRSWYIEHCSDGSFYRLYQGDVDPYHVIERVPRSHTKAEG